MEPLGALVVDLAEALEVVVDGGAVGEGEGDAADGAVEALGVERDGAADQEAAELVLEAQHRELDRVLGAVDLDPEAVHGGGRRRRRRKREVLDEADDIVDGGEVVGGVVGGVEEEGGGEVAGGLAGEGGVPAEDELLRGLEAVEVIGGAGGGAVVVAVDEIGDVGEAVVEAGEDEEHVFANLFGSVEALEDLLRRREDSVLPSSFPSPAAASAVGGGCRRHLSAGKIE